MSSRQREKSYTIGLGIYHRYMFHRSIQNHSSLSPLFGGLWSAAFWLGILFIESIGSNALTFFY